MCIFYDRKYYAISPDDGKWDDGYEMRDKMRKFIVYIQNPIQMPLVKSKIITVMILALFEQDISLSIICGNNN